MKVVNRSLLNDETKKFLKFLKSKYPLTRCSITFTREPLAVYTVNGKVYPVIFGVARETEVVVSTAVPEKILHTLAHEYRHVMQYLNGGCTEGTILQLSTGALRINHEEEEDADQFAELAISEFRAVGR